MLWPSNLSSVSSREAAIQSPPCRHWEPVFTEPRGGVASVHACVYSPNSKMSSTTSPSLSSSSLNSPSLANSGDTDATSRSSTPSDNQSTEPDSNDTSVNKHFNGLPWILHRILECQLSCELPLRIMFSFNSGALSRLRGREL